MTHEESGLGVIEYSEVVAALNEKKPFEIGKYAAVNGATNAVKQFKKAHPHLTFGESTASKLKDRYTRIFFL